MLNEKRRPAIEAILHKKQRIVQQPVILIELENAIFLDAGIAAIHNFRQLKFKMLKSSPIPSL